MVSGVLIFPFGGDDRYLPKYSGERTHGKKVRNTVVRLSNGLLSSDPYPNNGAISVLFVRKDFTRSEDPPVS